MPKLFFGVLTLLLCSSCITTTPTNTNVPVFKVYEGTYQAARSSEGVMKNWVLYSNHVLTGDWVTTRNSRSLGVQGHWEVINDDTLAFEASGNVEVFGVDLAKVRISGLGKLAGNRMTGWFILFVDQKTQWADFGNFEATVSTPVPAH